MVTSHHVIIQLLRRLNEVDAGTREWATEQLLEGSPTSEVPLHVIYFEVVHHFEMLPEPLLDDVDGVTLWALKSPSLDLVIKEVVSPGLKHRRLSARFTSRSALIVHRNLL